MEVLTLPDMLKQDYCIAVRQYIENVLHLSIEDALTYTATRDYTTFVSEGGYKSVIPLGVNISMDFRGKGLVDFSLDEANNIYLYERRKHIIRFMRKRMRELRSSK